MMEHLNNGNNGRSTKQVCSCEYCEIFKNIYFKRLFLLMFNFQKIGAALCLYMFHQSWVILEGLGFC